MASRYRAHSVSMTCATCGASNVVTMVLERGDITPEVAILHHDDGTHEPVVSGNSAAARARREGSVLATHREVLDS